MSLVTKPQSNHKLCSVLKIIFKYILAYPFSMEPRVAYLMVLLLYFILRITDKLGVQTQTSWLYISHSLYCIKYPQSIYTGEAWMVTFNFKHLGLDPASFLTKSCQSPFLIYQEQTGKKKVPPDKGHILWACPGPSPNKGGMEKGPGSWVPPAALPG